MALSEKFPLGRRAKIGIVFILAGGLLLAHYLTPVTHELVFLHDVYQRALYIPVVLAAVWFGWRGGLACAIPTGIAYFPHIHHDLGGHLLGHNLNRTLEIAMYVIIGGLTGYLADLLRAEQRRIQAANADLARNSEALREAMENLRARTREVFEIEEQLRRADRLAALGQLTAGLAHEIRNPLGSIRGAAEILGDAETPAARRAEFASILLAEIERLDGVLGNFLDYARSQKGGGHEASRLEAVLDRIVALLSGRIEKARIQLVRKLPGDLPAIALQDSLLQQMLLNLILNAVQAMPGGGLLRVEAEHDTAVNKVRIYICDSGPGIAAEIAERIFDPFFTTKATGTGLGLAIVHKIAAGAKGRVWLDATAETGTRFGLELPTASTVML